MANEKQVIDLPGTRVDTLWITVESGTNEDGTEYEKRQQTAPKTFERCVTDDDGKNLSEKLSEMQTQINGATSDVAGAVNEIIDERLETDIAKKEELNKETIPFVAFGNEEETNNFYNTHSNEMKENTWYRIIVYQTFTHSVLGGGRYLLTGVKSTNEYEWQQVVSYSKPTKFFVRSKNSGIWTNWERVIFKEEIEQMKYGENILINPNFKINQRGIRTLTTTDGTQKYTVDRWKTFQGTTNSITVTTALSTGKPSGITLRASNECWVLGQYTENFADYAGKTVTVSVKIKSMTGRWRVFVSDTDSNYHIFDFWNVADGIIKGTCTIGANPTRLLTCFHFLGSVSPGGEVTPTGSGEISVEWIKLEVGDTATAYMLPEPATELAKCQRYYFDSGYIYYDFPREIMELFFPVTMRAIPTVYVGGEEYEINGEYVSSFLLTENECTYLNKSGIRTNLGYAVSGSWLCDGLSADAEIY